MIIYEDLRNRCSVLRHKCVLLRQIHSKRMERFQRADSVLNIGTIIVASFLTFIGFFGIPKIAGIVSLLYPVSNDVVDLGFNGIVYLVLLFGILNVAFQFKEKAFRHWRAINLLTDYVTDLDTILAASTHTEAEIEHHMSFINYRYKHVVDILPPSTDADY